jgi:hypothetical protein
MKNLMLFNTKHTNRFIFIFLFLCQPNSLYSEKKILLLQSQKTISADIYPLKATFLQNLASVFEAENFVETGTYRGDSTEIAANIFKNVYSIELCPILYSNAKKRFEKHSNVHLYLGDSQKVLPDLLSQLRGKTIFYLDGHYSGGVTARGDTITPIMGELVAIKNSNLDNPIILIDDIRGFTRHLGSESDSPSLAYIEKAVRDMNPHYHFYVLGDMALAFHKDEPFTVSPLIEACTISRMAEEYNDRSENFMNKIYEAENIIAQANGIEKEALLELPTAFQENIAYIYRLWAALIQLHDQNYESATTHFETALQSGFPCERIKHYQEQIKKIKRLSSGGYDTNSATTLRTIVRKTIPLREDGKIAIPKGIKHIKLDIGLSYNAPMSQHWLSHENDLVVFGFEPNPAAVQSILSGAIKRSPGHGEPLNTKFIGTNFFLIPCALGLSKENTIKFFVTKDDCGCSSIYPPKIFEIERIIETPIFSLSDFFDLFPFDSHPVIDYIKIDAQGADLDIVKSAGTYLQERVVYLTLEAENTTYSNTSNSLEEIDKYMKNIGFIRYTSHHTSDPTYLNTRYTEYVKNHNIQIYQKG